MSENENKFANHIFFIITVELSSLPYITHEVRGICIEYLFVYLNSKLFETCTSLKLITQLLLRRLAIRSQ